MRTLRKPLCLALTAAALHGAAAVAQVPADSTRRDSTVFRVGEIVVQAARPLTTIGGASAVEVRIDSLGLPAAPTLAEVLRELPTIHVRTNSRGEAELAIRGSESRQVAVLLDGVPLTLGWDGRADVSVIPATAARQVTVVRGLSSVLHGPNVLGGVVEVGVGHGSRFAWRSAEAAAAMDEVGGYSASLTASVPRETGVGSLLLRGGLGYRDSPGAPLAGDVTDPGAGDPDLRLNTDSRQLDGFAALRHAWEAGPWLSVAASGNAGRRGAAAELGVSQPRLWRYPSVRRLVGVASGGTGEQRSPLGGVGDIEASLGIDVGRTRIDQYATRAYDRIIGGEAGDDRTLTLRLRADHTLGGSAALHTALTFADVQHEERLEPGAQASSYQQRLWSAAAEAVWRRDSPIRGVDNLRLSVGGAVDGADTPESGGKPALAALTDWGARAGASAVVAGGAATLHAAASRRVRFPSLRELYSGALGRFEPNPALQPERLVAGEAGATVRVAGAELQAVGFWHRLDDAIVREATIEGRFRRVNRSRITSYGVELLAGAHVGPLQLAADLTLQQVELRDPASPRQSEPEHQPRAFGSAALTAPLPAALRARLVARHTGAQHCVEPDTGGDRELPAGTRLDTDLAREWRIGAASEWFSRLEARVAIDNLADATTWELCGLPQPGRLARLQFRLF